LTKKSSEQTKMPLRKFLPSFVGLILFSKRYADQFLGYFAFRNPIFWSYTP